MSQANQLGGYKQTFDESAIGLYRFSSHYPLFEKPEHLFQTQAFHSAEDAPFALATGNVFVSHDRVLACEVITVHNDHPIVCWTTCSVLEPVTEQPQP